VHGIAEDRPALEEGTLHDLVVGGDERNAVRAAGLDGTARRLSDETRAGGPEHERGALTQAVGERRLVE
jgi:hypothetical protein